MTLQAEARAIIPVAELQRRVREKAVEQPELLLGDDEMIRTLLSWFKHEFFRWVHQPPCDKCQSGTSIVGGDRPTPEEAKYRAGHVEVYKCNAAGCNTITRFPRYNHAGKLMLTRRGRCGEYAQAFTLCARAMGFDARPANDWTDHVWCVSACPRPRVALRCPGPKRLSCSFTRFQLVGFAAPTTFAVGILYALSCLCRFTHSAACVARTCMLCSGRRCGQRNNKSGSIVTCWFFV